MKLITAKMILVLALRWGVLQETGISRTRTERPIAKIIWIVSCKFHKGWILRMVLYRNLASTTSQK